MHGVAAMVRQELEHIPVLRGAVLAALAIRPDGRYLDGTFGRGGHAAEVLERLDDRGRLLLMDRDPQAIAVARAGFGADPRVAIRHGNFADLADWSEAHSLDGVLLDLGVSSPQFDQAGRGFSFQADAPLDMRMDPSQGETAAEFLARASEAEIADVLWRFGEERMSRRIARALVARRIERPVARTGDLAGLIERVVGRRPGGKHPATRSFQALRIVVNGELDAVDRGLLAARDALAVGGRLAVISFHSLEDRAVKQFIRAQSGVVAGNRRLPPVAQSAPLMRAVGRKEMPNETERSENPRARSAVLRVAEKLT